MDTLDIGAVVQGAWRDALPILRTRTRVYAVFAVICALGGLFVPFAQPVGQMTQQLARLEVAIQVPNLLGAIAVFFVIPAIARTVRPDFRMTASRVLGLIGIAIVIGAVTEIGFMLLIVPGVWIWVKWSQTYWTFLLSEGKNPFGESWEITKGHFWRTLGFAILLSIVGAVPITVVFFGAGLLAMVLPVLGVVLLPIEFFGYLFGLHVVLIGHMRWMLALRNAQTVAVVPLTVPVQA